MTKLMPRHPGGASVPSGRQGRTRDGSRVLVLNASYEPLHVCTVRRAVVLVLKSKAEIVERGAKTLHSERATMDRPTVIRLTTYVRVPHDRHTRRITRRAVFARDDWTCQYCGSQTTLTIDHVVPRSKGGPSSWENIVASCAPCNRRKADKLPDAAGMHPKRAPQRPAPHLFLTLAAPTMPESWQAWMPQAA